MHFILRCIADSELSFRIERSALTRRVPQTRYVAYELVLSTLCNMIDRISVSCHLSLDTCTNRIVTVRMSKEGIL
jgi:hypothetical protein